MQQRFKRLIKATFSSFGIGITNSERLESLFQLQEDIGTILKLPAKELEALSRVASQSASQFHQDLFVLLESNFKRNGYFVEFGAADGIYLSNSYLLEKGFGWS